MQIELMGAIDFVKLEKELKDRNVEKYEEIVDFVKELERFGRIKKVASAGRLSRFPGDVFEVLGLSDEKTYEQNESFVQRVICMGHDSITDHDYLVFAIKNVSALIEQTIIAERFSSFTIKSRREVDFSNAGYYVPPFFHDEEGNIISENDNVINEYKEYMNSLFDEYLKLENTNLPKEDARFILPYCYYSNIIMGVDAHTLKDMIIKFTKKHLSKIQEVREFGEKLYDIAKSNIPYIVDEIEKVESNSVDVVSEYINKYIEPTDYKVLDHVKLISYTENVDDTILKSALMRRYQYDDKKAKSILDMINKSNSDFGKELIRKITFEGDKLELSQVNFQFQVPLSFAVLTHLTRHRTHQILIPEFAPLIDLKQYKVPPKANSICPGKIEKIFENNYEKYLHFKNDYNICDEDLVYFTLSGNVVNVVTNMDGKTVEHILRLRECSKAQWETQAMARDMHKEINNIGKSASLFSSILGSTCMTMGYCKEGKESCGRVYKLKMNNDKKVAE